MSKFGWMLNKANWLRYGWVVLFIAICTLRFSNLELDPPAYNQAGINATDEPYYCISAVNQALADEERVIETLIVEEGDLFFQHNHFLTLTGLKIFGFNYFGLRFPAVFLSCLSLLLLFLVIRYEIQPRALDQWLLLAFLGLEFTLFAFSRFQTPQLYSIFWISVFLIAVQRPKQEGWRYGLGAFVATISVLWVYPYLAFVALGFGLYCLMEGWLKRSLKGMGYATLGVVAGLAFVSLSFAMDGSTLLDYVDLLTGVSQVRNETNASFAGLGLIKGLLGLLYNFSFQYSPILLLSLVALPLLLWTYKSLSAVHRIAAFVLLMGLMQSMLVHSYPFKKWVVLIPIVVVLIFPAMQLLNSQKLPLKPWIKWAMLAAAVLMAGMNQRVNQSPMYWSGFEDDYFIDILPLGWPIWSVAMMLLLVGCMVVHREVIKRRLLTIGLATMVLSSAPYTVHYLVTAGEDYKKQLSEFGSRIGTGTVVGDFPHAYAFYTHCRVSHSPYNVSYGTLPEEKLLENLQNLETFHYIKKDLNQSVRDSVLLLYDRTLIHESGSTLKLYSTQ